MHNQVNFNNLISFLNNKSAPKELIKWIELNHDKLVPPFKDCKSFNPLSLLRNSVSKDVALYPITNILIEKDGGAVATNGRIVTYIPNGISNILNEGLYNPKTLQLIESKYQYPNWRKVIPLNYSNKISIIITNKLFKKTAYDTKLFFKSGKIKRNNNDIVGIYEGNFEGIFFEEDLAIAFAGKKSFIIEFSSSNMFARIMHENRAYTIIINFLDLKSKIKEIVK